MIQKALSKDQIDEVISLSRQFSRPAQTESESLPRIICKRAPAIDHLLAEYLRVPRSPVREVSRERLTTEHLAVGAHSPRSSHDAFIVEASPSRRPEQEYEEIIERPRVRAVSRPRSVSVHGRRRVSSPVRVQPREYVEERVGSRGHSGSLVLVRPRSSENDVSEYIRDLEEETRLLQLERQGGIEITRQRETDTIDEKGNEEEMTEIRRSERRGMTMSFSSVESSDCANILLEPNSRVVRAMMATLT